ncbi:hypothetical protein [Engelhardtia mirabilis]|uniref:Poly(ADP-ribose) polymerase and DNA-Ligase Zn-finger region n=1 Tax=Engelhardtia mirabilis TaxID=2528011 RepID=A0A518BMG3_9BACT|nr:Poly(ADP-ribose) polymerase and DNA-Ligase Zn-finger region [Planctomycetes bacterium Pla133]QDV02495.1 Poly(ADP-ribose) polymerase and DNA-Ligase Zn-finger region [Planctomycetes bacterium Pla86]
MTPPDEEPAPLPPYVIENARSGRSKCKTCRKTIDKDALRLGVLVEGPFGEGHMWHHLTCAAGALLPKVEQAYEREAWNAAKVPPDPADLPTLESLRELGAAAQAARAEKEANKLVIPYAEIAPSDRSKCKQSGDPIPKGAVRIVLGKSAQFGNQTRTSAFAVLPQHVGDALADEEIATEAVGLAEQLRANSRIDRELLEAAIVEIGEL